MMSRRIITLFDGTKMKRPKGRPGQTITPCHQCPKIPDDVMGDNRTRKEAIEPTERSRRAIWHYRRCKAVNRFPFDPIVERNAAIIASVEQATEEQSRFERLGVIGELLMSAGK